MLLSMAAGLLLGIATPMAAQAPNTERPARRARRRRHGG